MFNDDLVQLGELLADFSVAAVEEGEWVLFATLKKEKREGGWGDSERERLHVCT